MKRRKLYDKHQAKQYKGFTIVRMRDYMPPTFRLRGVQRRNGKRMVTLDMVLGQT